MSERERERVFQGTWVGHCDTSRSLVALKIWIIEGMLNLQGSLPDAVIAMKGLEEPAEAYFPTIHFKNYAPERDRRFSQLPPLFQTSKSF